MFSSVETTQRGVLPFRNKSAVAFVEINCQADA